MVVASPSASGPAGTQFEARVGAFYLLTLLLGTEARGLPGGRVAKVRFQGAVTGHPLDDVVVHAHDEAARAVTADIQAKRAISFSPEDKVFHAVLAQVAEAVKQGRLGDTGYSVAVAIPHHSRQIDGPYQDVLCWARSTSDAKEFFAKVARQNVGNPAMRSFVNTFRSKLVEFGVSDRDDIIFGALRRFQIMVFDFSDEGETTILARDRCRYALPVTDQDKAGLLWSALVEIALGWATAAGDFTLVSLRAELNRRGFILEAGVRENHKAIAALGSASKNALLGLRSEIASVSLSRTPRLELINASLDQGRYVEILGDGGVGKSGMLRMLIEQIGMNGTALVLVPSRIPPHGWNSLRQALGYSGSERDLCSDLASAGAGWLFIDSVDQVTPDQRPTVSDLVRAAAETPGFRVVVTARRTFGVDEPNWLPPEALHTLRKAPPVTIAELSDQEIDELRQGAPALAPLLSPEHPAKSATRNLFRLEWLFQYGTSGESLRTETEMAKQWWRTGDGSADTEARARQRILREMARQSLSGDAVLVDTTSFDAQPLGQLLKSGSLLDLGGERMAFRHDVFRDWAIACLLQEDLSLIDCLPLARLAPSRLSRGVELAARLLLESPNGIDAWKRLLQLLTAPTAHGSWARAATLALVRSENAGVALGLTEQELLANDAVILRDLIRTVTAVDMVPLGDLFAGIDAAVLGAAAKMSVPSGPSWRRLVTWILGLKGRLPGVAVSEVSSLYASYGAAMAGLEMVLPKGIPQLQAMLSHMHNWLMILEGAPAPLAAAESPTPFLDYDQQGQFHTTLQSEFAAFSGSAPALAKSYLEFLIANPKRTHSSAERIITSPGNLAAAAPKELAELTANLLLEQNRSSRFGSSSDDHEPFSWTDNKFLTPSPSQGPFYGLLKKDPAVGLGLVRRLVDHLCSYWSGGRDASDDETIVIAFDDGARAFIWPRSYMWARDAQASYSVTAGLMAVEAWAQDRLDKGDDVDAVLADVFGVGNVPCAYLLIAVSLLLSHWPKTLQAAVPFAASPELLAWDHTRPQQEATGLAGQSFDKPEPANGGPTRATLRGRPSRKIPLGTVLPIYALQAPSEIRDDLKARIERAVARFGPYGPQATFADPAFMAQHMLNEMDRANYVQVDEHGQRTPDGSMLMFEPPAKEAQHLAALNARRQPGFSDANLRAEIQLAFNDVSRTSEDLVERAIQRAQRIFASNTEQEDFDKSVLISGVLLMRDGSPEQRKEYGAWACDRFHEALETPQDSIHRFRGNLEYNPLGLATMGLVLSVFHSGDLAGAELLLKIAVKGDPAAAHGFGATLSELQRIDARLPCSVLRCAFAGSIQARHEEFRENVDAVEARKASVGHARERHLVVEWGWLTGKSDEPSWPQFPVPRASTRTPMYVGTPPKAVRPRPQAPRDFYADHQGAALWLVKILGSAVTAPKWMTAIAQKYSDWTALLNGKGEGKDAEVAREPSEWNGAYFDLVSRSLSGLDEVSVDALVLTPILDLPDRSFLNVCEDLQRSLDGVYFSPTGGISAEEAVRIRKRLCDRLQDTHYFRGFASRPGYGVLAYLNGALCSAMMVMRDWSGPPKSYILSPGMAKVPAFVPTLSALALAAPSLFMGKSVLALGSVSADYPLVDLVAPAIAACNAAFPDDTALWSEYGLGRDFCVWAQNAIDQNGVSVFGKHREDLEKLISNLIRLGVSEAAKLEAVFSA